MEDLHQSLNRGKVSVPSIINRSGVISSPLDKVKYFYYSSGSFKNFQKSSR